MARSDEVVISLHPFSFQNLADAQMSMIFILHIYDERQVMGGGFLRGNL